MQKTIKILFEKEKEKKILCESKEIDFSSMTITAQKIFDLLDYSIGDIYQLEPIDFNNIDKKISDYIQPIYNLIKELVENINKLAEETTLKQKEEIFKTKRSLE